MIRVVVGELSREPADAVVRPADAGLAPVGPAAARLDEAGGARFTEQRRTATPLESGAAVVTGGGDLPAGFALHVVVVDERGAAGAERIRRALVSAWQRAEDWQLRRIATPLVGVHGGPLSVAEAATLLVETLAERGDAGLELVIVVEPSELEAVEAIVGRTRA
ncbi:MAG TPA: macro domain-containing protein [Gemmatimonadales bacterium]|nr:macro domain-containing protein [Gemmatimonadales bacterium]